MKRAIVIRTVRVGDPDISGPIAKCIDGMTERVIPLNTDELDLVKAELARLKARDEIRNFGDSIRWDSDKQAMAINYQIRPIGNFHKVLLVGWAMFWDAVHDLYIYFSAWNRGEI